MPPPPPRWGATTEVKRWVQRMRSVPFSRERRRWLAALERRRKNQHEGLLKRVRLAAQATRARDQEMMANLDISLRSLDAQISVLADQVKNLSERNISTVQLHERNIQTFTQNLLRDVREMQATVGREGSRRRRTR